MALKEYITLDEYNTYMCIDEEECLECQTEYDNEVAEIEAEFDAEELERTTELADCLAEAENQDQIDSCNERDGELLDKNTSVRDEKLAEVLEKFEDCLEDACEI